MALTMKQGDRSPSFRATLTNADGSPIDLTGATANIVITTSAFTVKVNSPVTILAPVTSGEIQYDWGALDTDTVADYNLEIQVTLPGGRKISVPNDGYEQLHIIRKLA